jgi:hypothetical protein
MRALFPRGLGSSLRHMPAAQGLVFLPLLVGEIPLSKSPLSAPQMHFSEI